MLIYWRVLERNKVNIVDIRLLNTIILTHSHVEFLRRKASGNHDGNVQSAPSGTGQIL